MGSICPVVLSAFVDLLLFRFYVLGFLRKLSQTILWWQTELRDETGFINWTGEGPAKSLHWKKLEVLVAQEENFCIPWAARYQQKGQGNRWVVAILGRKLLSLRGQTLLPLSSLQQQGLNHQLLSVVGTGSILCPPF